MTVTAIVPMKGHSARVPNKNIRPLCGRPLFHWIVEALLHSRTVTRVVVETDADHIAEDTARHFPSVGILRRPDALRGDTVPMNALIAFHLSQLDGDVFLQTHSTNPLLTAASIDGAVARFREPGDHDSLFTVNAWHTRFYWPDGRAVNHDPAVLLPTQDLPPVYEENSCLYLFSRESFSRKGRRIGQRPLMFVTPPLESIDIDEMHQFRYAEFLMAERLGITAGTPVPAVDRP